MIHTVQEAETWFHNQKSIQSRVGLDKIYCALAFFDDPHQKIKTIHIAGTNGKGSVSAFLTQLLISHGLKVGTFTSPHIHHMTERIRVNNQPLDEQTFIHLMNQMVRLNQYMATTDYGPLMFFELYTLMMFVHFAEIQPDICIIEVGIGGLYDCTNVIDSKYNAIVSIGFDHTDKLGSSVDSIAFQKAGIIKDRAKVFLGNMEPLANRVITAIAEQKEASIQSIHDESYKIETLSMDQATTFIYKNRNYQIQMIGAHQVHNAVLAMMIFEKWMADHQLKVDGHSVISALKDTQWIGRMEKVIEHPLIYIDGAHNVAGLEALNHTLKLFDHHKKLSILFSGLKTKDQQAHLQLLDKMPAERLVFTTFNHPQAMSLTDYQDAVVNCRLEKKYEMIENWQDFFQSLSKDEITVITGSLYFISQVRYFLLNKKK